MHQKECSSLPSFLDFFRLRDKLYNRKNCRPKRVGINELHHPHISYFFMFHSSHLLSMPWLSIFSCPICLFGVVAVSIQRNERNEMLLLPENFLTPCLSPSLLDVTHNLLNFKSKSNMCFEKMISYFSCYMEREKFGRR